MNKYILEKAIKHLKEYTGEEFSIRGDIMVGTKLLKPVDINIISSKLYKIGLKHDTLTINSFNMKIFIEFEDLIPHYTMIDREDKLNKILNDR